MKIITAIPLYRNKFQKTTLFFSNTDFSIGSIAFVHIPFKSTSQNRQSNREKPAVVIDTDNLENKKAFIRRNKIKVSQMNNEIELPLFRKEIIEIIKTAEEKTKYSFEEIFQKILPPKIIQEINKLKPNSDTIVIKKSTNKLSLDLIREKLRKKPTQSKNGLEIKEKGIKTIGSILDKSKEIKKTSLHTEKHYLVDEIRNYFGETAKKGKGSFGFYIGFFNRTPKPMIYQYWSEVRDSRKSIKDQQKLFWWKIGQYLKTKKK